MNEKNEAQKIKELVDSLQKNLDAKHTQCIQDLDRLSSSKKSYIDQRINKSYLLQEAMLQYPLLRQSHHEQQLEQHSPGHHQSATPHRQQHANDTNFQSQSPTKSAAHQNFINEPTLVDSVAPKAGDVRYKRSEAERDLAAALELQLGAFMSKLSQVRPLITTASLTIVHLIIGTFQEKARLSACSPEQEQALRVSQTNPSQYYESNGK